jgi:predicted nucleotide-binding protein
MTVREKAPPVRPSQYAKKSPSGLVRRFDGVAGQARLLECICEQTVVAHDASIARCIRNKGMLRAFRGEQVVTSQGSPDNSLYLVICGSVDVSVNKRVVATRNAGTHVGEMAAVDAASLRSATITSKGDSVLLQLSAHDFRAIAERFPKVWQRLTAELAGRLRERSRFHRVPHSEPEVFVGSSKEALAEATHLATALRRKGAVPKLWSEGVFTASKVAVEDLWKAASDVDFAVLVLTPDDMAVSRGEVRLMPRDNVIFELGLFMGSLGRDRAFIVKCTVSRQMGQNGHWI